jgi:hypothetical protein
MRKAPRLRLLYVQAETRATKQVVLNVTNQSSPFNGSKVFGMV